MNLPSGSILVAPIQNTVIVNHRGEILEKGDLRTDAYPKVEEYVDALHKALKPNH